MRILFALSLTVLIFSCESSGPEDKFQSMDYKVYMGDNLAGYHKSSMDESGTYVFEFTFNDRGRGPFLNERIQLNRFGSIESLDITGHNYLKDTVDEVFIQEGRKARWKSTSESGESDGDGKRFYYAMNGTFGSNELLMQKLLNSPDQSVDLLPGGNVRITDIYNATIGDSLDLKLLEVTGFSFTPSYVWHDMEDRFFASVSTWLSCVRSGYDSIMDDLLKIQQKRELAYYSTQAETLTQIPDGPVIFDNVDVFDSRTGTIERNRSVKIDGELISDIGEAGTLDGDGSQLIDGTGKTLLPGLFDMHAHIFRPDGILNLAAGVTSVRDLANSLDLLNIRDEFDQNMVIGPRIQLMCGFIDQAGPYAGPTGKIINDLEEGLDAIQFYRDLGYDQIKLYSSIDPSWVKPMAARAHTLEMKVSGHIPAYMLAHQAVRDGYDEIQHVNMIVLNFLSDTIDTRTPLRFSMIAEHAHNLDLDGPEFRQFVNLLKNRKIVVDPTVSIFENMLTTKAGQANPLFASVLNRLPILIRRGYYSGGLPIPDGKEDQYRASYQKLLDIVYELYSNDIQIVAGTDAMAGFALHGELENYVRAGIPAGQVLKIATRNAATVLGIESQFGAIEEGMMADLVLVDGDPVDDISQIRNAILVVKDGKIYDPVELYKAIGVN